MEIGDLISPISPILSVRLRYIISIDVTVYNNLFILGDNVPFHNSHTNYILKSTIFREAPLL